MVFKNIKEQDFAGLILLGISETELKPIYNYLGQVPGSNRIYFEETGTYEPQKRTVRLLVKDSSELPRIKEWLSGSGKLYFEMDNSDQFGYYKARVISYKEDLVSRVNWQYIIEAEFECEALKYLASGEELKTVVSGQTIYNPGSETVYPYIKITGTGTIDLAINGTHYNVIVNQELEINFPIGVYKGTVQYPENLSPDYPVLVPGNNVISWTVTSGTISKVEVMGRWQVK